MKTRTIVIALALVGALAYGSYMTFQVDLDSGESSNNTTYDVTSLPNTTGVTYANESRVFQMEENGYTFFAQLGAGLFGTDASDLRYEVNLTEPVPYFDGETDTFIVEMVPQYVGEDPGMEYTFTAVGTGGNANASFSEQMVYGATPSERTRNVTRLSQELNNQTGFEERVPYEEMMFALTQYPYNQSMPALNLTDSWERTVGDRTITFEAGDTRTYGENPLYSATNITMTAGGEQLGTFSYSELKNLPRKITYTDAADTAVEGISFERATGQAECSGEEPSPNCE
ncbi:hypothetical protein GJ629_04075 [Halapricum sp. CBA1109]|uniref:hypothetical protein n=1 Tax=Halapricum sp. CBA1109 TaxID=2668068 RepID=UPI0012FB1CC3|nr:hypothetical protein [Halapricum sp. CBA1109]MUV89175.1 hypothetical protein [Halapricum sp. CBA1109]